MRMYLCAVSLVAAVATAMPIVATTLPDSCGKGEVMFDVKTVKNANSPSAPENGKALVVFVENFDSTGFCIHCEVTTRVGIDGAWVGANRGNSYFSLSLDPGEHHLCADWQSKLGSRTKMLGLDQLVTEPGKTYYYEVKVTSKLVGDADVLQDLQLAPVSEDEAKYRMKISGLSMSTPHS